jgi:hypothetical protein
VKGVPGIVQRTLIRPPASRMGPVSAEERAETLRTSPVAGKYDRAVDSRSAHEILAERTAQAAGEAARAEEMERQLEERMREYQSARRYEPRARTARAEPSLGESLAKTVVKQLGTREGQRLVRGILGGLFRGR